MTKIILLSKLFSLLATNYQIKPNYKVVLATGVFDIIHQEHVNFLKQAKASGSLLLVGLETDQRVRKIKGQKRPVNKLKTRLKNLQKLNLADFVFSLPKKFSVQSDWETFIKKLKPNIYAVSSHASHLKNKRQIMKKFGGCVKVVYSHQPSTSTSILLENKNLL